MILLCLDKQSAGRDWHGRGFQGQEEVSDGGDPRLTMTKLIKLQDFNCGEFVDCGEFINFKEERKHLTEVEGEAEGLALKPWIFER